MRSFKIIMNGILYENPTFVQCIGLCPTLATSTSALNGLGMGFAAMFVLIASNMAISLIRKITPDEIRLPIFIVVIAGFVTVIQFLLAAFAPALNKQLGIFIPLIVVNCIILARAEAYAFKNTVVDSALDGLGMGLGFTLALTFIGILREFLGNGTIFGLLVTPAGFQPGLLVILAPGGFITLGICMALIRTLQAKMAQRKGKPEPEPAAGCSGCPSAAFCGSAGKEAEV